MKKCMFILLLIVFVKTNFAQEIVLDLDSIKNIKTTRYSSINEVGVNINIAGKTINKFPDNTIKNKLAIEKPGILFRTVHGALLNPHLFIGAGIGINFRSNNTYAIKYYYLTFPIFAELRQYVLNGNFNVFFSERLGGGINIDTYANRFGNNGTSTGAFGEFMIGGRYVLSNKKLALHFGVGYGFQHLQRRVDLANVYGNSSQIYSKTPEITIKHYVPVSIGVTF